MAIKRIRSEIILVAALSIIAGFSAGIIGYVAVNYLPFWGQVNIGRADWDKQIVIDQPRNVVVEQDLQIKQVENDVLPAIISVYKAKQSINPINQIYLPGDLLSAGVTITADGWVVVDRGRMADLSANYEAVGYQLKKYKLARLAEDKATGLIFAKTEANNLPVAKIGNSADLRVGQTVAVISRHQGVLLTNIKKIGYEFSGVSNAVFSSDELAKKIILNLDLTKEYNGAALVNLKGEVVGVVVDQKIIPVNYFKGLINQVLSGQAIYRPSLDFKYIDLAQVDGLIAKGDKGAMVYGNLPRTSPLFGQVADGDVIKKIDDVEINANQGLSELLSGYKSGNNLEFLVQRGGSEFTVDIVLK